MSRVEEDRDEARTAARLAEQRRAEASRRTRGAEEAGAFAARVAAQRAQDQGASQQRVGQGAVAQLLEEAQAELAQGETQALAGEARRAAEGEGQAEGDRSRLRQRAENRGRRDGQRQVEVFAAGEQTQARAGEDRGAGASLEARGRGSLEAGSRLSGRYEERREVEAGAQAAGRGPRGEVAPADPDGGGGRGAGGQGGQQPPGGAPAPPFRLNPALMPPVPVAQRRDTGGSDRLRAVANELAQKIVERVRVGTNALGRVEFQVDLRGDVLAGLSVRVSANRGRITAVFSGSDRGVLTLIEQHGEALRGALAARGLTLEALRTEARP